MVSARRPFDSGGPFVVACEDLVCSAGRLRRGADFPTEGLTPHDLLLLWVALQIDVADHAVLENVPTHADPDPARMSPEQRLELAAPTALPSIVTPDPPRAASAIPKRVTRR